MPPNTVYVGRPTIFGNPFKVSEDIDAARAVRLFKQWLNGGRAAVGAGGLRRLALLSDLSKLRGKDLACFCKEGAPCHADILLELANQ